MLFIVLVILISQFFFLEFCYINSSLEEHFLTNVILLIKLFDDNDDDFVRLFYGSRNKVMHSSLLKWTTAPFQLIHESLRTS